MVDLIEDIILEGSSQERTELPFDRIDLSQRLMVEKMQEKTLRQILGLVRIEASTPDKQIDRLPIDPTNLRQRILGAGRLTLRRKEDRAPTGGAKSSGSVCWRWRLRLQSDPFRFSKLSETSRLEKQILHVAGGVKSDLNETFSKKLKLRAKNTFVITRTHLTSLVRH